MSASAGSGFSTLNSTANGQSASTYTGLFGSFGGGSSGFGFGEGGSFGSFGRAGGDTIKSDYDQERLLQQLLHSETLHVRVKNGAATVVNLLSPWLWPDRLKEPRVPVWPVELRGFKEKDKEKEKDREKEKEKEGEEENGTVVGAGAGTVTGAGVGTGLGGNICVGDFPKFLPTVDEMIDLSGSR